MSRDTEIPFDQFLSESIDKVDDIVKDKITSGFIFDGLIFSMSIEAQLNWSNLFLIPDTAFPLSINSKNDDAYSLSLQNRPLFYQAAMNHKMQWLMIGGDIKNNMKNSSSVEEVIDILSNFISQSYPNS